MVLTKLPDPHSPVLDGEPFQPVTRHFKHAAYDLQRFMSERETRGYFPGSGVTVIKRHGYKDAGEVLLLAEGGGKSCSEGPCDATNVKRFYSCHVQENVAGGGLRVAGTDP